MGNGELHSIAFILCGWGVGRACSPNAPSAGVPLCGWVARSASTPYLLWVALPFRVARSASKPYLFWGAYLLWVFC